MVSEVQDLAASRQQQDALLRLLEVTCELAGHHSLDQILKTVTSGACEALGCERASLYLYDADRQEVYTRIATELEIEEIRSSIDRGVTGWVARNREVANIPDPVSDPRWNSGFDKRTGFHTRNILAAPIISAHEDRLIGVLQLLNKHDGPFGPFDEQMIRAFAAHAATALERASLVADAQRSHELQTGRQHGPPDSAELSSPSFAENSRLRRGGLVATRRVGQRRLLRRDPAARRPSGPGRRRRERPRRRPEPLDGFRAGHDPRLGTHELRSVPNRIPPGGDDCPGPRGRPLSHLPLGGPRSGQARVDVIATPDTDRPCSTIAPRSRFRSSLAPASRSAF